MYRIRTSNEQGATIDSFSTADADEARVEFEKAINDTSMRGYRVWVTMYFHNRTLAKHFHLCHKGSPNDWRGRLDEIHWGHATRGPRKKVDDGITCSVYLPKSHVDMAQDLGGGKVSHGIRRLVSEAIQARESDLVPRGEAVDSFENTLSEEYLEAARRAGQGDVRAGIVKIMSVSLEIIRARSS